MNAPYELPENQDPINSKYVILEGIEEHNRFFTNNSPKDNEYAFAGYREGKGLTKPYKAYIILGYANTIAEAQMFLHGHVTTKFLD